MMLLSCTGSSQEFLFFQEFIGAEKMKIWVEIEGKCFFSFFFLRFLVNPRFFLFFLPKTHNFRVNYYTGIDIVEFFFYIEEISFN